MDAIGLILDGTELRLARLRSHRQGIDIVALERIRLAGGDPETAGTTQDNHYREVMGLADAGGEEGETADASVGVTVAEAETEADLALQAERTLHNTLFRHAGKGVRLGIALGHEEVTFSNVALPADLPARKRRRYIRNELQQLDPATHDNTFDFVPRNGDSVLAFAHRDMALLQRVRRVNDTLAEPLRIDRVGVNEVALLDLVVRLIEPSAGMSVLVYAGNEVSRLLFIRDGGLHDLSPVIHEGVSAVGTLSQCYGRIVAELDVAGVDTLDAVYIAGDADTDEYRAFFQERFPGCAIASLPFAEALSGDEELQQQAGAFALPISLAWSSLDRHRTPFSQANFLPADLRRGWWSTALAWHGWALLGVCALTLLTGATAAALLHGEARELRADLHALQTDIDAVLPAAQAVDEMARRIAAIGEQRALVDSLRPDSLPAADLIGQLTTAAGQVNSTWLSDLSIADGTFAVQGVTLYGNRIHRFAEDQPQTTIHAVSQTAILGKPLYEFDLSGPVPPAFGELAP